MLDVLVSPLSYLRIRRQGKPILDWLLPVLLALLTAWVYLRYANASAPALTLFFEKLLSFVSILPGFYIAALTAVVTFTRQELDTLMADPAPQLTMKIGGHKNSISLTRRRFVAFLFSFLCAESLLLCIYCLFMPFVVGALDGPSIDEFWARVLMFLGGSLLLWQIVFVTLFGLFYLGDRLLKPSSAT
jgi:hypothetical protein